jgi:putative oxidoreductase
MVLRSVAVWLLRVVLGFAFLGVGIMKLTGTGHTVEWFAAIGWGQWFRYLTGCVDVLGAALLFVPRWTRYGAIALTCSVGLASLISVTVLRGNPYWGNTQMVVMPFTLTCLTVVLAALASPLPDRRGV